MRSINKEKEESNVVILENSITYFVILGISKFIRCLKKIIAIKKALESWHQTEYPTWNGLWPPPASKENPDPEYNCNATTGIVNLSQGYTSQMSSKCHHAQQFCP